MSACTPATIRLAALALLTGLLWPVAAVETAELRVSSELLRQPAAQRERAVQARLAATPLSWPAGRTTLAAALGVLAAHGNATTLAPEVDGGEVAEVPALNGDYWQGVVALCAAFDLVIGPGEAMDQSEDSGRYSSRDNNGTAVIAMGGPVVLAKRAPRQPPPIYVPCGALLAHFSTLELRQRRGAQPSRSIDAVVDLRFEPHVQPQHLGTALVAWATIEDTTGRKLELAESTGSGRATAGAALHLPQVPDRLTGFQLGGELIVQLLEPVELTALLRAGASAKAELMGQGVEIRLLGENDATAAGQKGPGLSVSVPTAILGARPRVVVKNAGQPAQFSLQGSQWSGGRIELFYRGPKLADAEYSIEISGQAALQQVRLPLKLGVGLDRLPGDDSAAPLGLDLQVPTRVAWPAAAQLGLQDAVKLLATGGNQVLLELGADERRRADLPAFSGSFWEGALVLCRAYQLAIVPPARSLADGEQLAEVDDNGEPLPMSQCIAGGPLVLGVPRPGRRGPESYQPCGILLMGIDDLAVTINQGLGGVSRQADISYRLRLEPRFDAALIGSATVAWTTLAGQSDGRVLVVEEPAANDEDDDQHRQRQRMRFVRVGRRMVQMPVQSAEPSNPGASGTVAVGGLPAGPVTLTLNGQATLYLRRAVRAEAVLAPGGRAVVQLSGHALSVRLFTNGGGEDNSNRNGVSIDQSADALDSLNVEVRSAAGKPLRNNDTSTSSRNGRPHSLWFFPDIDKGDYTVVISAKEHLATLRLPFTLTTTTP
jgi:hypothetical protein